MITLITSDGSLPMRAFGDSHGGMHRSLFNAILADLGLPLPKWQQGGRVDTLRDYFSHADYKLKEYEQRVQMTHFQSAQPQFKDTDFFIFRVSSVEDVEIVCVLLGLYAHMEDEWNDPIGEDASFLFVNPPTGLEPIWTKLISALADVGTFRVYATYKNSHLHIERWLGEWDVEDL